VKDSERDLDLLSYIEESLALIEQYSQGGREVFFREQIIQDAILRRLETLADAAHRLSQPLKQRHPTVPWREIYGFRNVAAHGYLELRIEVAWETIETGLPGLKLVVAEELRRLNP